MAWNQQNSGIPLWDQQGPWNNYPGGRRRPGINPNHVAFRNAWPDANTPGLLRFSGYCSPLGFNCTFPAGSGAGAYTGTPTITVDGIIGPALTVGQDNSSNQLLYSNHNPTAVDSFYTVAAIVRSPASFVGVTGATIMSTDASNAGGIQLWADPINANAFGIGSNGSNPGTTARGPVLTGGVPYFLAGSWSSISGVANLVTTNLSTGAIRQTQVTAAAIANQFPSTPGFVVGNVGAAGNAWGAGVACVAWLATFMTPQDLLAWAQDPWSFWYPSGDWVYSALQAPQAAVSLPAGMQLNDLTSHTLGADRGYGPDRTWVAFYNPSNMNTGQKPVGAVVGDLSPRQPPPRPDETWTWNYNPTYMNSGARPAGAQSEELSPGQVSPRPDETWTWFYNPTQMNTGAMPLSLGGQNQDNETGWSPRAWLNRSWDWSLFPGYSPVALPAGEQLWDLPPGQIPWRPDKTWVWNYNPTQMQNGKEPFFQTDWPIAARPRQDANYDWPSSATQKLVMPIGKQSTDLWSQPGRLQFSYDQRGILQVTVTALPFNQYDWPLPTTWTRAVRGALYGRVQSPQQTPFAQYDWPLPTPNPILNKSWDWSTPTIPVTPKPFFQSDWPLPGRHPRPDETWVWNYNPSYMAKGAKPFSQTEWPLPQRALRIDETWISFANPGYFPAAVTFPFNQYDWPLPVRPFLPQFSADLSAINSGPQFILMPLPVQWDLPAYAFQFNRSYDFGPSFYFPPPVAFPFNQYDWPLPGRPPLRGETWAWFYNPTEMATGAKPFAQIDWPLPMPRFRMDATWLQQTPVGYFPFKFPFNQYYWPLPQAPFRIEQTISQFYNPTQMLTGTKPFSQNEWPLPMPPNRGGIDIYTITAANNPNIYIPTPPTTVKIEWLIRARRRGRR